MSDSHRFLLLLVSGLLLFGGLTAVALERTDPTKAAAESPLLEVGRSADWPTTVLEPPTTAPPETTTSVAVASGAPRAAGSGGAVAPPRNSYAPEPIQEIGTIEIPKIGLRHKVMHGITLRNIDHGPSHWPGTPLPGEVGNVVFMGHRVTHSHPFRRIDELVPGDEILFEIGGVRSRYLVTGHEIVTPNRLDIVNPTPDPTLTIFACHPPGSARQRYVVRAALAAAEAAPTAEAPAAAPAEAAPPG
jgi:sortase A